ncbi:MAG: phosphoribosyltransferase [Mesonia sp.]|uniref:phosphoribosyltransferase n=1 Tax=Mesonia sp. TaxID=1960830 RepID=UPI00324287D3|tara:strand:+ start:493 stop:1065 length:573 start_codon:yes stop_codon:yes gene_type:complete
MKVVTLDEKDILTRVNQLIQKIDFEPDVVIGVLNGAYYLVQLFKDQESFSEVKFYNIKLQRQQESFKKKKTFNIILKLLPYWALNKLRILESKRDKKSLAKISKKKLLLKSLHLPITFDSTYKRVLIVDDALDTGKTMFVLKNNLKKVFSNSEIKVAVIAWTIENSIVKPDFYIFKNILVRFPWSKDFKK